MVRGTPYGTASSPGTALAARTAFVDNGFRDSLQFKKDKTVPRHYIGAAHGFIDGFGETRLYYHECMFNVPDQ